MSSSDKCQICEEELGDNQDLIVEVKTPKGIKAVNKYAKLRRLSWTAKINQRFHIKCRINFTQKRKLETFCPSKEPAIIKSTTRLLDGSSKFDYRTCCLFCTEQICKRTIRGIEVISKKKEDVDAISFVKSKESFDQRLRNELKERSDDWSFEVRGRVESVSCLRSEEAVYHRNCCSLYYLKRKRPGTAEPTDSKQKKLSPEQEAFIKVLEYFEENEDSYLSINDLQHKMSELVETPYTTKWIKSKLVSHYGDSIVIVNMDGREDVLYFRKSANSLLYTFYEEGQNADLETEKQRVIKLAASLIKSDIAELISNKSQYFALNTLDENNQLSFLPKSLLLLLGQLSPKRSVTNEIKYAAIGQSIIQLARPYSIICPLQVALGVEVHHKTGSEFMVQVLNKFGFSSSITEVRTLEKNLCLYDPFERDLHNLESNPLYSADNADVNIGTLDGKNTLHVMGMIRSTISRGEFSDKPIERKLPTTTELRNHLAPIFYMKKVEAKDVNVVLKEIKHFNILHNVNLAAKLDVLRICAATIKDVPQLSGYMRLLTKNNEPGHQHTVDFLPFIDLNPSDESAVFTTLMFVINQCQTYGQRPILTFDQPLWLKAMIIKTFKKLDVTILLGNFHTQMSFLSAIGYVMANSGIKEVFTTSYAENSVDKMLLGKYYTRCMRANDLASTVLKKIIIEQVEDRNLIQICLANYEMYVAPEGAIDFELKLDCIDLLETKIEEIKKELSKSETNKLWMTYIAMVDMLNANLMAERTGNWDMYLSTLQDMLPFFAGSGRNHYTKSLYWFLQEMSTLDANILEEFKNGLFVVRRGDVFWSGVSPDLCIEQTLMASLKGSTGLTRGRSLTEISRLVWVLSRPGVLSIDAKIREMTETNFKSSEQSLRIKHVLPSIISRNSNDMTLMEQFFKARYVLNVDAMANIDMTLRNIANGLVAPPTVSVTSVQECGSKILSEMAGSTPVSYKFKRAMQAEQMPAKKASSKSVKLDIDPDLLFQRILSVCTDEEQMNEAFSHDLAHYPPSLFGDDGFLRSQEKSSLGRSIIDDYLFCDVIPNVDTWECVLDGGYLLHTINWQKGCRYNEIIDRYISFVRGIGNDVSIVFDGYLKNNTKDQTHEKRYPIQSLRIDITEDMIVDCDKGLFLSNSENKQQFVNMLGSSLLSAGYSVIFDDNDADVVIVQEAINTLHTKNVRVIADDTDILILLLSKVDNSATYNIYLQQPKAQRCINITTLVDLIPDNKSRILLLSHAISGCDTTSFLFGVGKTKMYKKEILENDSESSDIFYDINSTESTIIKAGENIMMKLYTDHKKCDGLNSLRRLLFKKQLNKRGLIQKKADPRRLPPSSSAAAYHSLRVYHQVQEWLGNSLDPLKYGWEYIDGKLSPITTELPIAPESILHRIKCGCRTTCSSGNCSCKRISLYCTKECGCKLDQCSNVEPAEEYLEEMLDDEVTEGL